MDLAALHSSIDNAETLLKKQTELVTTHASMIKRIAYYLMARLPKSILLDDLIQAGMVGLLEASKNYDPSKGASFETYASIRVRGHMLDEVRRNDWVPRSVYKNSRRISEAVRTVENRLGRDAKDSEIAQELKITLQEYHEMLQDSMGMHLYSFDEIEPGEDIFHLDPKSDEPFHQVQKQHTLRFLIQIIQSLPEKEKLVLSLYYERELNLKEIGLVLGVSESRVSQIHSQAMHRIRSRFALD